ncbi:MAG: thiamine phosphate synthase [Verrucomicrobiota bacterium]
MSELSLPHLETTLAALQQARLYGILDTGYSDAENWPELTPKLIAGGAGILQIRAKGVARSDLLQWTPPVLAICRRNGVPLILNDHPELAAELKTDGCHLGQDDLPLAEARQHLLDTQILGKSTHSLQQALDGEQEGADYIGFGPIFSTPTKPDYTPIGADDIREMYQRIKIPAFCIGGIKRENTALLARQGARRVVVVSGILQAESPQQYAAAVLSQLT